MPLKCCHGIQLQAAVTRVGVHYGVLGQEVAEESRDYKTAGMSTYLFVYFINNNNPMPKVWASIQRQSQKLWYLARLGSWLYPFEQRPH